MIIDGRAIAADIKEKIGSAIRSRGVAPTLGIVIVGDDAVIESFVRIKKKFGESLGITILEFRFPVTVSGEELLREVKLLGSRTDLDGLIVQLPLPSTVDTNEILSAVPTAKDIDMLAQSSVLAFARGEAKILPPVAGAIQEILERQQINIEGKEVLVLGHGRLVGKPVTLLLQHNHAHVTVVDKPIADLATHVREADIVITGVGTPMLITPEMVGPHTVLIDAGTSEAGGRIVGDADPMCAEIAALFTPVPGGVGPIAVAMLFKNLVILSRET